MIGTTGIVPQRLWNRLQLTKMHDSAPCNERGDIYAENCANWQGPLSRFMVVSFIELESTYRPVDSLIPQPTATTKPKKPFDHQVKH